MSKSGKKSDIRQDELLQEKPEFEHTGQYLKKLRTEKGLSIKDVANATRISVVNLNAIEAQEFHALPADTFTKGFLSLYAKFLGTDPARIVQQFMEERDAGKTGGRRPRPLKQPSSMLTPKTLAEPSHFSSMTAAIILFVIIAVLFTAFCLYTSWNPFSFLLSGREKNFQSILTGLEQSYPEVRRDDIGTSRRDGIDQGVDPASPAADSPEDARSSSAGETLDENNRRQNSSSLSRDTVGNSPLLAGKQERILPEKMTGSSDASYSGERFSLQGDE